MSSWRLPLLMAVSLAGCTAESDAGERIIVFAAASLTEAMHDLIAEFERKHPGSKIVVNLAGSNQLALQIEQMAPAHVYISADPHWTRYLVDRGLVATPVAIASNTLVIATPQENPGAVSSWTDLTRDGLLVVMAAPEVPAGRYADSALSRLSRRADAPAGYAVSVRRNVVSQEESVKGVVAKLLLGEADAGFVYRTDIISGSGLRMVRLPDGVGITEDYLMAVVAPDTTEAARLFAAFVRSDAAQQILNRWGFQAPNRVGS